MEKYDVKFKKKFGQNFLKDINIVKRIVDVSGVDDDSLVIEVGPGGAIMTRELALKAKNVLAYEIDTELELQSIDFWSDNFELRDALILHLKEKMGNFLRSFPH